MQSIDLVTNHQQQVLFAKCFFPAEANPLLPTNSAEMSCYQVSIITFSIQVVKQGLFIVLNLFSLPPVISLLKIFV